MSAEEKPEKKSGGPFEAKSIAAACVGLFFMSFTAHAGWQLFGWLAGLVTRITVQ